MTPAPHDTLRADWLRIAILYGAHVSVADRVFDTIVHAYAEPLRRYHTLDHVAAILADLDRFAPSGADRTALSFAAWFHDVIYDTRRQDNEKRSADMAANILRGLVAPEPLVERVAALVLATRTHDADPADADALLFLDADLAILGADEDIYDRYSRAIREEYAWVDEDRYREGRRGVLERFLEREKIYRTDAFNTRREERARRNIERELERLRQHLR